MSKFHQAVKVNDYKTISQTYMFYIYLGKKDCEEPLIEVLNRHGDKAMGEDYLNCGNEKLDQATRDWCRRRGYRVVTRSGAPARGLFWEGCKPVRSVALQREAEAAKHRSRCLQTNS